MAHALVQAFARPHFSSASFIPSLTALIVLAILMHVILMSGSVVVRSFLKSGPAALRSWQTAVPLSDPSSQ